MDEIEHMTSVLAILHESQVRRKRLMRAGFFACILASITLPIFLGAWSIVVCVLVALVVSFVRSYRITAQVQKATALSALEQRYLLDQYPANDVGIAAFAATVSAKRAGLNDQ